eukprot:jgi/Mesvir1/12177/Mv00420-RA.1
MAHRFEEKAFIKLLLHALKYPSKDVNGVLLGTASQNGQASSDEGPQTSITVVDAVPLFHGDLALAPMLEMALMQVDEFCSTQAKTPGLQIIGYYHANQRADDYELGGTATKIADRIAANANVDCAVLVNNRNLHLVSEVPADSQNRDVDMLMVFSKSGDKWVAIHPPSDKSLRRVTVAPKAGDLLRSYHSQGRQRALWDFDDHLDDVKRDWRNLDLLD